ncbi:MAG: hypothetical protein J6R06_05680 [Bacteroidales bacterium]|nr:hypothetical protein [Bacteroidales bacterium]
MKKILVILAGFMISCTSQATNTESNTETGVESDQIQMKKSQNKVIKKSIEKTENNILIKEYDKQGNLIKITDKNIYNGNSVEFTLRDGKILSAKGGNEDYCEASVNKQKNTATYCFEGGGAEVEFNEFGYSKIENLEWGSEDIYEYNEAGLLVRIIGSYEGFGSDEFVDCKNETTFSYDVNNQDWTKRTETYTSSCISNKTKKTKVMDTSTSTTTRTVEYW